MGEYGSPSKDTMRIFEKDMEERQKKRVEHIKMVKRIFKEYGITAIDCIDVFVDSYDELMFRCASDDYDGDGD
jgi:hypothetical protein